MSQQPFLFPEEGIAFFGRPYAELMRAFGLDEPALRAQSVLECPSGPSSFVAEACRRGIRATGADPLFYRSPAALRKLAMADFERMVRRIRAVPERFARKTYSCLEDAVAARRAGLETFLGDYRRHFPNDRYRCMALPSLSYPDRSFDIVLCGHLLFIYEAQFDEDFHERALRELCRVAAREVRVHPLVDGAGRPAEELPALMEQAEREGFEARVRAVDHEFFRGANQTLVLTRRLW